MTEIIFAINKRMKLNKEQKSNKWKKRGEKNKEKIKRKNWRGENGRHYIFEKNLEIKREERETVSRKIVKF